MASIKLSWQAFKFPADTAGWVALKKVVDPAALARARDPHTVYVIRICRPFSFRYPRMPSPVIYIGRGNFKARITLHLTGWIQKLGAKIRDLEIEVLTCMPMARHNAYAYRDVEADLIDKFSDRYGEKPYKNRRRESHSRQHQYSKKELSRAFGRGKGTGYHFAIEPMGSSPLKRA